jgi:hypothetical protein
MMVMSESDATLVLDARAAAGLLQEIFVGDATTAGIQCAPMGAVLRCIHCGSVLIRAVHTPPGPWLDMAHRFARLRWTEQSSAVQTRIGVSRSQPGPRDPL